MSSRVIKIAFSAAVGLYITLVCFNNIVDYRSNFPFVEKVATMADTFAINSNGWRSVNSYSWHRAFFICILITELTIALFMWLGTINMIRHVRTSPAKFKEAGHLTAYGLSLGVMLWFVVFIAIGGEWFLMWQSKTWNAQSTAFLLTICFLLFLLHHNSAEA